MAAIEFSTAERVVLALAIAGSATLFARDLARKLRLVRLGRGDRSRTDALAVRLARVVREVVFQSRVVGGRPVAGLLHAAVFGGFVVFSLETLDHFLRPYGLPVLDLLLGAGVPAFKAILAVCAVAVALAIAGLAFRRFILVKISPDPKSYSSGVVALMIFLLMATFLYAQAAPGPVAARGNWWLHAGIILVFPHLILRSKHFHIVTAPVNIFFRNERLGSYLPLNLDLEEMDESEVDLGLERVEQLTWKQRLDFATCVECRRCTDHCPAHLAGQELDPRAFILAGRKAVAELAADQPVLGNVLTERALGQCTSCGACENACPVGIEHLQVLIGAKRAQALASGTGMVAADFLRTVERTGNALGGRREERAKRIAELEIPAFVPGETELLLWLGCLWSYNPDARGSLAATVSILRAAGVSYGVLEQESCVGHHSRRQGEEMQFQTLAQQNLETLQAAGVRKILTGCPHCLHTLLREYPTLDARFRPEVIHHSQYIAELVSRGAVQLDATRWEGLPTTYHDPCYLGRYEGEFAAPRALIRAAGLKVTEMAAHGPRAVCCGGGSAGFAREQDVATRVDQVRSGQARATGARLLVTGCPECKMMLGTAVEQTRDVAEVVAHALASPN